MSICSICLETIKDNESLTTLSCTHSYHYTCLFQWNTQSNSSNHQGCPICRDDIGVSQFVNSSAEYTDTDTDNEMPDLISMPLFSLDSASDHGIIPFCIDCYNELEKCEICNEFLCNCLFDLESNDWNNRIYHSPENPFGGIDGDEPNHKYCSQCFKMRNRLIFNLLEESLRLDNIDLTIRERLQNDNIRKIFEIFFRDTSDNDNSSLYSSYPQYNWNSFLDYMEGKCNEYLSIINNENTVQLYNFNYNIPINHYEDSITNLENIIDSLL